MSAPILNKNFFRDHPPDSSIFKKWKNLYNWKNSIVPIYEWNDMIYVGCLQKPFDFPSGPAHAVFCICDAESLLSLWEKYNDEDFSTTLEVIQTPTKISSDNQDPFSSIYNALAAEGIQISSADSENITDFENPVESNEEITYAPEGLEGIDLNSSKKNSEKDLEKDLGEEETKNIDNAIKQIFLDLNPYFQKSMILLQSKDGMTPFKWNDKFEADKNLSQENFIPLEPPSPFRIVYKTQKPYHGYVIANEINSQFFNNWNNGHIPEHLTLVPILVEDQILGMLLFLGNKTANTTGNLYLAEKAANDLATVFISSGLISSSVFNSQVSIAS